ncbi:P-loop containing nucleoside triphosphate hydrolase protein [Hysterangium stoloniferum]|nr:P-loop containing nucleoside triphosphate hydrolase protein [Hysterangium stoloniferum]
MPFVRAIGKCRAGCRAAAQVPRHVSFFKALLWMLPAKTFWSGKSVIVVVPLVALLADCERRCQEAGVTYAVWSKDDPRPFTSVVFVSAEEAITGEFLGYAKHMCALGRLMYIYIEEGHLIMVVANYREKLPYLRDLYGIGVPVAILSATLPPHVIPLLQREMNIGSWHVIRAPTVLKHIDLRVPHFRNTEQVTEHALKKIGDWKRENALCDTRCLVIGTSKQSVETLARAVGVPHYHGELTIREKGKVFENWVKGEHKAMVATTGCGTRIDLAELNMVMNVGAPYDAMTLIQNIGRANRDGSRGVAYLFVTEDPSIRFVKQAEDIRGINVLRRAVWEERTCRWVPLTAYNDGRPVTCSSLASFCHLCAARKVARRESNEDFTVTSVPEADVGIKGDGWDLEDKWGEYGRDKNMGEIIDREGM